MDVTAKEVIEKLGGVPDVIWASPTCTTHSVAAIYRHREKLPSGELVAKSDKAKLHDRYLKKMLDLIEELNPKLYFVENPRSGMRKAKLMQDMNKAGRHTVTYCQYGDTRMKPTDIWTNHPNPKFKPPCKNGDKCHEPAPRGSKTGTQGLKGNLERSKIPKELCQHIVNASEELLSKTWEEFNLEELKWKLKYLSQESYINDWQNEFVNEEIKEIKKKINELEK